MRARDFAGDNRERLVSLVAPFNTVRVDKDRMSLPIPLAHEPRARLDLGTGRSPSMVVRICVRPGTGQLSQNRLGETAERPLLDFVSDTAQKQIAGEALRGLHMMQPPPLSPQLEVGQGFEPHQLGGDV